MASLRENNNIDTSDNQNNQNGRGPQDSYSNFTFAKNDIPYKEIELEMSNWRASSKLKGAIWYFVFGLFLLIAGIVFAVKNDELKEIKSDYYSICTLSQACTFSIFVTEKITGPVYMFIEMKNYYQNTYFYLKAYKPSQINSDYSDGSDSDCDPFITNGQIKPKTTSGQMTSINGSTLNDSDVAFPCGIRAYDHFTDTFAIRMKGSSVDLVIKKDNISWKYDREHIKNKNPSKQWVNLEDEALQVWLRPSGLSKFRKTIGRIDQDLLPGEYVVTTNNSYDHVVYDSTKTLVLATLNSTGGKNQPLVVSYLAGGSIILLGSVGLMLWHFRKRIPQ